MSGSGSTFILVATYPDEATAREDYQVVKDAHAAGLVGFLRRGRGHQGRQRQGP